MRTLIVIGIGLGLASVFVAGAGFSGKGRTASVPHGRYWFLILWLVFRAVNFAPGVFTAGDPANAELLIHLLVFAIPAAAVWFPPRLTAD
ncbi:MAG: hypothetical protein ACKV2V_07330 [Blastocatellia bacterium]